MSESQSVSLADLDEFVKASEELGWLNRLGGDEVSDLKADSRRINSGDLFIALEGHSVDGHDYVADAFERGAAGAIIRADRANDFRHLDKRLLVADDTRRIAGPLASMLKGHPSRKMTVVGVAGTNGKTTMTRILGQLAEQIGLASGEIGTLGYRWGGKLESHPNTTPGAVDLQELLHRMCSAGVDICFMEVSSHGIAEDRVRGVKFDAGVFGNLSQDHLDYHGTMRDYRDTVFEFFTEMLPEQSHDEMPRAIVNEKDTYGSDLIDRLGPIPGLDVVSFGSGESNNSTIRVRKLGLNGTRIESPEVDEPVRIPLIGEHNVENVVASVTTLNSLGYDRQALWSAVEGLASIPGRLEEPEREVEGQGPRVFIDYAHSPDSLERVLQLLFKLGEGRLTVVFGCGGDRDRDKRPKMGRLAANLADRVVLTNDNPRSERPGRIISDIEQGIGSDSDVQVIRNRGEAIEAAILQADDDDVVLIAGKGHETYQESNGQRRQFSDIEKATAVLEAISHE